MRKPISYIALVISVGILGWAWGARKRTDEELNSVYYPTLYSEVIRAIDPATKQSVDFEIKWREEISPSLKSEPTRVLKFPDKTQSVTLLRRHDREEYSFDIHAAGYKNYNYIMKPAQRHLYANVMGEVVEVVLTPMETGNGNPQKEE